MSSESSTSSPSKPSLFPQRHFIPGFWFLEHEDGGEERVRAPPAAPGWGRCAGGTAAGRYLSPDARCPEAAAAAPPAAACPPARRLAPAAASPAGPSSRGGRG